VSPRCTSHQSYSFTETSLSKGSIFWDERGTSKQVTPFWRRADESTIGARRLRFMLPPASILSQAMYFSTAFPSLDHIITDF
jgi:hypothetical protein